MLLQWVGILTCTFVKVLCLVCRSPAEHSWSNRADGDLMVRQHWSRQSVAEPLTSRAAHDHTNGLADMLILDGIHAACLTGKASAVACCRSCHHRDQCCPGNMHSHPTAMDKTSLSACQLCMSDVNGKWGARQDLDIPNLDRSCSAMSLL